MTSIRAPRWALSFADLCLVLLAFFVLMQARNGERERISSSMRAAFGGKEHGSASAAEFPARSLFERGEAVLMPEARARFEAMGRDAAAHGRGLRITSTGMDPAARRFDDWELAAARVAAVARALRAGGLAERRIAVTMPQMGDHGGGQRISVLPLSR